MGTAARGTNLVIKGFEFQHQPWNPGRREGQSCLCDANTVNIPNIRLHRASWLVNTSGYREGDRPQFQRKQRRSCAWNPSRSHPKYPFTWLFICLLCNKPVNVFPCVPWAILANFQPKEGLWESSIYGWSLRKTGGNLRLVTGIWSGQSCGNEPSIWGLH